MSETKTSLADEISAFIEGCDFVSDEDKERIPRVSRELDAQSLTVSEAADRHMSLAVEVAWIAAHYNAVSKDAKLRFIHYEAATKLQIRVESERRKQEGSKSTVPEWVADALTMSNSTYGELHREMVLTERLAAFLTGLEYSLAQRARLLEMMSKEAERIGRSSGE